MKQNPARLKRTIDRIQLYYEHHPSHLVDLCSIEDRGFTVDSTYEFNMKITLSNKVTAIRSFEESDDQLGFILHLCGHLEDLDDNLVKLANIPKAVRLIVNNVASQVVLLRDFVLPDTFGAINNT